MRRAARVDGNQAEIMAAFRKCGFSVADTSKVGGGFPDLVIARAGFTALVEVKIPKGKLRQSQTDFAAAWKGHSFIVRNLGDVAHVAHLLTP